jgi:hypothetical protein
VRSLCWEPVLHVLSVTSGGILVVGGDVENGTSGEGQVLIALGVTGSDFGALGIQGDSNLATSLGFFSGASIVNDRLVIFVGAVGEVHAHNIKTGSSELVDGLDRVCLGTNSADDRSSSQVLLGGVGGVERGQPLDAAIVGHVVGGGRGHRHGTLVRHVRTTGSGDVFGYIRKTRASQRRIAETSREG